MMAQDLPPRAYTPQYTMLEVAGDMLCSWCFQPSGTHITLKKCVTEQARPTGSPAFQKKDWKLRHKYFCPRFQKVNKYDLKIDAGSSVTLAELVERQDKRKEMLKSPRPEQHEPCENCATMIFKHEVVCEVCFKTLYRTRPIKFFASCPKCQLAQYCSNTCKSKFSMVHSKEQCDMLALLHATKRTDINYHLDRKKLGNLGAVMSPSPRKHQQIRPNGFLYWLGSLPPLASSFPSHNPQVVTSVGQLTTESKSFPFTVISGLERAIPKILTYTSLEIHIVGASSRELGTSSMAEDIIHHFPRLKCLHLCFIGPRGQGTH
ncbi:hypothetical protein BT96DRAFT_986826 [Gymnopus androsaceus JB14]|uniref:MYND-type domain-containing protein n=1 Tax=Gymnopus androsaceus JB14 TaxID=1447944 RepID=A0A6A4IDK1_9AGAR|nr:hypothetical protein BT96DRAFT_986826 [Gymnopus androsaceus JB14]